MKKTSDRIVPKRINNSYAIHLADTLYFDELLIMSIKLGKNMHKEKAYCFVA